MLLQQCTINLTRRKEQLDLDTSWQFFFLFLASPARHSILPGPAQLCIARAQSLLLLLVDHWRNSSRLLFLLLILLKSLSLSLSLLLLLLLLDLPGWYTTLPHPAYTSRSITFCATFLPFSSSLGALVIGPTPQQDKRARDSTHPPTRPHTHTRPQTPTHFERACTYFGTSCLPHRDPSFIGFNQFQSHLLPDIDHRPRLSIVSPVSTRRHRCSSDRAPDRPLLDIHRSPTPSRAWNTPRPGVETNNSTCSNPDQHTISSCAHPPAGRMPSRFGA